MVLKRHETINAGLLLFLALAITVPWGDVYRFFFFALAAPLTMYSLFKRDLPVGMGSKSILLMLGILAYLSISTFFLSQSSFVENFSRVRWGGEIALLVAAILFSASKWWRSPRLYGLIFLGMVFLSACLALVPFILQSNFDQRLSGGGFLFNPIRTSSTLLLLWAIGATLLICGDALTPRNLVILSVTGLSVICVCLFSQSRGPILAAVVFMSAVAAILSYALMEKRRILLYLLGTLSLALVAAIELAGGWAWVSELVVERGLSYRPAIWRAVIEHSSATWIFGAGEATPFWTTEAGRFLQTQVGMKFEHTHNIFFETFQSGGIIVLSLFLWLLISLVRAIKTTETVALRKASIMALLGLTLMVNLTDTVNLLSAPSPDWILLWLPLAFCVSFASQAWPESEAGSLSGRVAD